MSALSSSSGLGGAGSIMRQKPTMVSGQRIAEVNRKLFGKLDRNKDGQVSFQEMQRSGVLRKIGVAKTGAEEKEVFAKADIDGNGLLSRSESYTFFAGQMQGSPAVLAMLTMIAMAPEEAEATQQSASERIRAERDRLLAPDAEDLAQAPQTEDEVRQRGVKAYGAVDEASEAMSRIAAEAAAPETTKVGA